MDIIVSKKNFSSWSKLIHRSLLYLFQTVLEAVDACQAKLESLITHNGDLTCREPTDELDEITDPQLAYLKDELDSLHKVAKEQEDLLQEAIQQQVHFVIDKII